MDRIDMGGPSAPSPANFDEYLPWACNQMSLKVVIHKVSYQDAYLAARTCTELEIERNTNISNKGTASCHHLGVRGSTPRPPHSMAEKLSQRTFINVVYIETIYNTFNDLIQIKFVNNKYVPKQIFQIMSFIINFHPYLTVINIDSGLEQEGLCELNKILIMTKITDVILDNTMIPKANYSFLFEKKRSLNYLSLANCNLNDAGIENIASCLPTSTLSVLNVSYNNITDKGAKYLGIALRFNRNLRYLNLAHNSMTDIGADSILSSLMEFRLTHDEINEKRVKHTAYLKEKHDLIMRIIDEIRKKEFVLKESRMRSPLISMKQDNWLQNLRTPRTHRCSSARACEIPNIALLEKAQTIAENILEPFIHPFNDLDVIVKDNVAYCLGNNTLSYLNLAFNKLSCYSVKKLYNVLLSQEILSRQPKGLVNVCIEGNNIPESCSELKKIGSTIEP